MRRPTCQTNIKLTLEDDTEVVVTEVSYYKGLKQTLEAPEEPEEIEILKVEDSDGVEVENWEELITPEHQEEVEDKFHWVEL